MIEKIKFKKIRYFVYGGFVLFFVIFYMLLVNPIFLPIKKSNLDIGVSKEELYKHVLYLTSFDRQRTYQSLDILNNVSKYIYNNFKNNGCDEVSYQIFKVGLDEYKNVICKFKGSGKKIVIGGHYDVYGEYTKTKGKKLIYGTYQGADDNASAVAGILELSRLIGKNKLGKNIEIVAYTLEEPPYFDTKSMGSYVHAKNLFENNEKIDFMISLEMIGFFSDEKIQEYQFRFLERFYPREGNFIALLGELYDFKIRSLKESMISYSEINTYSINSPKFVQGLDFSDHRNYWKFGYKAYMITDTSFLRNKNYHTKNDTINTLNFDKMKEVIKGVYGIIKNN